MHVSSVSAHHRSEHKTCLRNALEVCSESPISQTKDYRGFVSKCFFVNSTEFKLYIVDNPLESFAPSSACSPFNPRVVSTVSS